MEIKIFCVFLICILQPLKCFGTEEEIIETQETPEIRKFIPGRQDILMHQQTEAIRRIVHAKSLELSKPFDLNDSLLLTKCQEIAAQQRSNSKIQAEALTNDTDTDYEEMHTKDTDTTTKYDENIEKNVTNEQTTPKIVQVDQIQSNNDKIDQFVPPVDQIQSNNDKIDQFVTPVDQIQSNNDKIDQIVTPQFPPLLYFYPKIVPKLPENDKTVDTTTTTTTHAPTNLYREKFRFIVRMPYPKQEKLSNFPFEFDKYAYFPRSLQPDFVNMPVPYAPTYHMIRKLIIPNQVPGSYIVETNS